MSITVYMIIIIFIAEKILFGTKMLHGIPGNVSIK